jgi:hypothetical protein
LFHYDGFLNLGERELQQAELKEVKEENETLRNTLGKTQHLAQFSMTYSTTKLPAHLSMFASCQWHFFHFTSISLVENPWNDVNAKYTISGNVATLNTDDKTFSYRVQGVRACSSFTVLFNASNYHIGFMNVKMQRQWMISSLNTLKLFSYDEEQKAIAMKHTSANLPISPSSRDDVFVVSRAGNLIEFLRNGKKIPLTRDNFTPVEGFEIAPTDELFPVVLLHNKGDSVKMLEYQS